MLKIVLTVLTLLAWVPGLYADEYAPFKNKLRIFIDAADFYWDEHSGGQRLLKEDGAIFGVGATYKGLVRKSAGSGDDSYRLTYGGLLRLYFGQVDYDGQTQPPESLPVQTTVDYLGITAEGRLGWLFKTKAEGVYVEPNLGLGVTPWSRDLNNNGIASGYTENWLNIYSRLGLTVAMPYQSDHLLELSAGMLLPLMVRNSVDVDGTVTLEPKAFQPSPYVDLAFEYKKFSIGIFYDSFNFGESPKEIVGSHYVLQPESYTYQLGLRLGYAIF